MDLFLQLLANGLVIGTFYALSALGLTLGGVLTRQHPGNSSSALWQIRNRQSLFCRHAKIS